MDYARNDRIVANLLDGCDWVFLDPSLGPGVPECLLDAWGEIGEALTRFHVFGAAAVPEFAAMGTSNGREEPRPGSRPAGWWEFEAREPVRG